MQVTSSKLLLILVVILSLIPRLWQLRQLPPVVVDEPANVRDIQKLIAKGGFHPIDYEWGYGQATLVYYPTILLIKLGIQDEIFALRLTSVIESVLVLIPFFLLITLYTDQVIAICTTLLFSYSYYFLQFSRVGWTNIHPLTLGIYLLWFIQQAHRKIIHTVIAGILTGLLFYVYRAGEIFIGVGTLFFLITMLREKLSITKKILFILTYFSLALIIALPWIIKISSNSEQYTLRERVVSVWNAPVPYHDAKTKNEILLYQLSTTTKAWILMLPTISGGIEAQRYLPLDLSIINPLLIPLFFIGLLLSITNSTRFYPWLLIFFLSLFFGQIATVDPPNGSRGLIMLPCIYIFIAISLFAIRRVFYPFTYGKIALILISLGIALGDFLIYQNWMNWITL